MNSGLSNLDVRALAVSPNVVADQTLLAGTYSNSVFRSTNGGSNWSAVNIASKFYDKGYVNWLDVGYYDTFVAEGNVLAFGSDPGGLYEVTGFTSSDVEVYDVSDMTHVQRFINTTVAGGTVRFGDASASRYLALTPAAWLTPLGFAKVTYPVSPYTPADLLDTGNGADYIVISHAGFWPQALRLASYRAVDYRVALIDVQQIYDQFNGGLMSAESIHDFLEYAYYHWQAPRPAFVVLLGDGTYDMRQYLGNSALTYIPPFLHRVDEINGETAADNLFATLVGDDIMPDVHIGRLPANSLAEAEAMIDKIVAYELGCACGTWGQHVLFVADDLEGGGGNFYAYSNALADGYADPPLNTIKYLPESYASTKVYLGAPPEGNCDTPAACSYEITQTLNTSGALLVSYIGHSLKTVWGAEDRLLDQATLATLESNSCLPIMLAMTCETGFFHEPQLGFSSLAEAAVRQAGRGAVAYWGSAGGGLASGQDYLEKGFFLALFHGGADRVGVAVTEGKRHLVENTPPGRYDNLMHMYTLFGDPALKVKVENNCVGLDSDYDTVPDSVEVGPDPANPLDTDGDGIPNYLDTDDDNDGIYTVEEDMNGDGNPANDDTDGDGIANYLDYDPTGYLYDEDTGQILTGGFVTVTGPGNIHVTADGSTGYYQFFSDGTPGTYTMAVTPPPGYVPSTACLPQDPPPFDPTGGANPIILGSGENGSTGFLSSNACTAFYYTLDLAAGDPFIVNNNFPFRLANDGVIGDFVWWDVNGNGRQDPGEPGIPGVGVALSDSSLSTTDVSGLYAFTGVPSGMYTLKISDDELQPGGTLYNWFASPRGGASEDVDSDGDETTHDATVILEPGEVAITTDFGFDIPSSYVLTQELNTQEPVSLESESSFTIHIANSGSTTISTLPLRYVYSTTHLSYVSAIPAPDNNLDDGMIDWSDLTDSFGQDLAPGAGFTVIVTFKAIADTTDLPDHETVNTALVDSAWADPDGFGPLEALEELPGQETSEGVEINLPTGLTLAALSGVARPDGVLIAWETASELHIVGFNVLRREAGGELQVVNDEFIFAACAGASGGAAYAYQDKQTVSGTTYEYVLEMVKSDGSVQQSGPAWVTVAWWTLLPLVMEG